MIFEALDKIALVLPDTGWVTDPWGLSIRLCITRSDHPEVQKRLEGVRARQPAAVEAREREERLAKAQAREKDAVKRMLLTAEAQTKKDTPPKDDEDLIKLELAARVFDWEGVAVVDAEGKKIQLEPTLEHVLGLLGFVGQGGGGVEGWLSEGEIARGRRPANDAQILERTGTAHKVMPAFRADGERLEFGGRPVGDAIALWIQRFSADLSASRSKAKEEAGDFFGSTPAGAGENSAS